jgi:hypothetical protein
MADDRDSRPGRLGRDPLHAADAFARERRDLETHVGRGGRDRVVFADLHAHDA